MTQNNFARDFAAGLVASSVSLAYCFSFGALIFAGPLQQYLGQGIAAALICSAATGLVSAFKSGFPLSVSGPEGNTVALLAAMTIALSPALAAQPDGGALYLGLAALGVTGLVTAIALYLLGQYRLGRLARFIPYPVLAGFQAASGWIMAAGAIRMSTGVPIKLATVAAFADPGPATMLAVTALWAIVLWQVTTRIRHFLALPAALAIAAVITDIAFRILDTTGHSIGTAGWMFPASKGMDVAFPLLDPRLWHVKWALLVPVSGEIAAVAMMAALTIALHATSIEQATRIDVDLDRELRVQGLANVASALLGGIVGHIVFNRTILAREAGGTGRVTGAVTALVGLAALGGGLSLVSYIPRFVLAGLLLELGARTMWRWCISSRRHLEPAEWLLILAILGITAYFGILIGFLIGILGGCVIFAVSVSRVDIVKHSFTVDERPSSLVRSTDEMALIAAHGGEVRILQLASFIFFGSAYRLQERIRALLSACPPRMVVFDFTGVSGIDSSAGSSLLRIEEMLRDRSIAHVLVGISPDIHRVMDEAGALENGVLLLDSLDLALELGENTLIDADGRRTASYRSLADWLTDALGAADQADALIAALEPATYAEEAYLCRAGDPTDTLLFIESGRVSAEVQLPGHAPIRQRVFGANTILGEVGFFLDGPRTTDLRVYGSASVWALGRTAYERLSRENPGVTTALLTYTVQIQAERLAFSSRQVEALQR